MKIKTIYLATILSILSSALFGQKIIGYLPYYRGYNANFDYNKYTHLHYFAIWPAADGSFIYPGSEDSLSMAAEFNQLSAVAKPGGTKMIMTFGGTAENGSKYFAEMAKNAQTRAIFIANVITLAKDWNADGIDIDWEWGSPNSPQADRDANGVLLTELRTATTNNNLTLSVDVSPSSYNGNNYDAAKIELADYINVMSYSYNGSWAATTGHHTPLGKIKTSGIDYWTGRGITKSKMNIGSAFYGFHYSGTYQPGQSFTSMTTLTYTQIKSLISSGYTVVEDNENGTYCYSVSENKIAYYDSQLNVANKMDYIKDNGLSGVIIWEIGQDDADQSLSTAIHDQLDPNVTSNKVPEIDIDLKVIVNGNQVTISNSLKNFNLKVINTLGQVVSNQNEMSFQTEFTLEKKGIYFIQIESESIKTIEKVLIK